MWRVFGGVVVGYSLARWVIPAITKKPFAGTTQTSQADGRPAIHRITGDAINTFDALKPFLYQIHMDSADGELGVADWMRAARQLQQSGVI